MSHKVIPSQVEAGDIIRAEIDSANILTGTVTFAEKVPSRFAAGVYFDRLWVHIPGSIHSLPVDGPWLRNLTFIRKAEPTPAAQPIDFGGIA